MITPRASSSFSAALLSLALIAGAGQAAAASGKTQRTEAARDEQRAAPRVRIRPSLGQSVFQILLAETALHRRNLDLAANAYSDLSLRTRDPKVLARTIEVAAHARRYDLALEVAQLWVDIDPQSLEAHQAATSILLALNRLEELAPHIAVLLAKDTDGVAEGLLGFSRMITRYQDKAAAYRLTEQVVAPHLDLPEAHFALAVAATNAGDVERARQAVRKARNLKPEWENAALLEAQIAGREGAGTALAVLETFLATYPEAREVRLNLARMLIGERRGAEARRHFEYLRAAGDERAEILYPLAILALQRNDPDAAEGYFKDLLRSDFHEKGAAYYYLGQIAEDRGNFGDALANYALVATGQYFAQAQGRFAQILARQKNIEGALRQLQEAREKSPDDSKRFRLVEAQILREAGRAQEAMQILEETFAGDADHTDYLYDSALIAERLGRFDLMETRLRRLIEVRPDSAHAYNALGYSLADRNLRLDEALALIGKALELAPDDPFILDSMGWALYRQGKMEAALQALRKAFAAKADAEIAAHLTEVLWASGKEEEARTVYGAALKINPDNATLQAVARKYPGVAH